MTSQKTTAEETIMERNIFERKKNTKQNKSCLQDEVCLGIETESPKANYDTSMHMFERSQKSSNIQLPKTIPTPHPSPRHCAVLFPDHRSYSSENQNTSVILPRR